MDVIKSILKCFSIVVFIVFISILLYVCIKSFLNKKRTLKRITLEDAVLADETFTVLMGEKVEPRKEFIEQNAKYAVNLDF